MKTYLQMFIFIGGCFILLPIFVIHINHLDLEEVRKENKTEIVAKAQMEDIMDEKTLIGILAKEIPYTYELEAIKAQAVVERTYMARRILGIQNKGAIIGYTTEELKVLWGEHYDMYYKLYQRAVEETRGKLILYNQKPIEALYHVASSGKTRDAKEVYQKDIPYLKSVDSKLDRVIQQFEYRKEDIIEKIKEKYPSLAIEPKQLQDQIQIVDRDEAEYVMLLQIGNVTLRGEEFKEILDLPSTAFKIYNKEDALIFDVKGIGSGIGLSQNGANELAKQGMDYEQIIKSYYKDVELGEYEYQN